MQRLKVRGVVFRLSDQKPNGTNGVIADRTHRGIRLVEVQGEKPGHMRGSERCGDYVVHNQIAWSWTEGEKKRTGTVQGYPSTIDGPWKFKVVGKRVLLWANASEVEGTPAPHWTEVWY
jgi:hypothetical protein